MRVRNALSSVGRADGLLVLVVAPDFAAATAAAGKEGARTTAARQTGGRMEWRDGGTSIIPSFLPFHLSCRHCDVVSWLHALTDAKNVELYMYTSLNKSITGKIS